MPPVFTAGIFPRPHISCKSVSVSLDSRGSICCSLVTRDNRLGAVKVPSAWMHVHVCKLPSNSVRLDGPPPRKEREERRDEQRRRQRERSKGTLSRQAVQSRLAMSPCHRHGNAGPADSFGLIGSCQGNDKINAARDGDIERWA